jgi:hypothetical protein
LVLQSLPDGLAHRSSPSLFGIYKIPNATGGRPLHSVFPLVPASMEHKPPPSDIDTLENLLQRVSKTREELLSIERAVERLKADATKLQKRKDGSKTR